MNANAVASINLGAVAVAFALSTWAAVAGLSGGDGGRGDGGAAALVERGAPRGSLRDHAGADVPLRPYRRIGSGSSVGDDLLLALCEPDRIAALTAYSARRPSDGYRYAGPKHIENLSDIEFLLSLKLDLLLVSNYGDSRHVERLREAMIPVYDLGPMRGMSTFIPNIDEVAKLLGHPERGARFATSFQRRMASVAGDAASALAKDAMYLSSYGGHLFGGTQGTSYHDVLVAAGLVDVAAARFVDWPEYTPEQILNLNPAVIVAKPGMRDAICGRSGFERLRACHPPGIVAEVDDDLLNDPGVRMLEAAEAVRDAAYGPARPR